MRVPPAAPNQKTNDARCQVSFLRHCSAAAAVGSLTPIKPGGSRGKKLPCRKGFLFRVGRLGNGRSVLISPGSSDVFRRPAKHLFGLRRAGQSALPCSPHLNPLSRAAIKRRGPVQKLSFSSPTRCPFNAMSAARWFPTELRASVFCGRAPGADAPNLCFVIASFVPEDVGREIERAGGGGEPTARAPGGRTSRGSGRWPPLPINAPESRPRGYFIRGARAQRRPAVLGAPVRLVCDS